MYVIAMNRRGLTQGTEGDKTHRNTYTFHQNGHTTNILSLLILHLPKSRQAPYVHTLKTAQIKWKISNRGQIAPDRYGLLNKEYEGRFSLVDHYSSFIRLTSNFNSHTSVPFELCFKSIRKDTPVNSKHPSIFSIRVNTSHEISINANLLNCESSLRLSFALLRDIMVAIGLKVSLLRQLFFGKRNRTYKHGDGETEY
ncbi:hypothetical protein BDF20DRAFT_838365 [Mycotypha africana]|uniref:uncharacterized protein n=1 Tax=Mycotypha africana TaxID=64632 RepID=UPI002301DBA4|nr:uncharacterized protein BDF20DRAFT_838365 [Mycotypha africana]KAI8969948.1 hypothetical protein BDF20DRAFT_838365 [Mycotypha africana]